jgi:hypothetical protein
MTQTKQGIPELSKQVAALAEEMVKAAKTYGLESREYREIEFIHRAVKRRLDGLRHIEDERQRRNAMTPQEVADEIWGGGRR